MDWRCLADHGEERGGAFYQTALEYGQTLWQRRLPARAILCLDRAMGADLRGDERELAAWPMPYPAMAYFLRHAPDGVFVGNPRVHFQHYADRMNEPRRELRATRAWACWALACVANPSWPADPRHAVQVPSLAEIRAALRRLGLPGEAELWENTLTEHPSVSLPENFVHRA
ncbi:hypothetical protein [Nibricoccus sp. IMCC34717]|uniref:hypothetical protein n=1 Tax=Nibricoccus sp. IMCC34717 TaxID=3034021 RepID=UPI00384A6432